MKRLYLALSVVVALGLGIMSCEKPPSSADGDSQGTTKGNKKQEQLPSVQTSACFGEVRIRGCVTDCNGAPLNDINVMFQSPTGPPAFFTTGVNGPPDGCFEFLFFPFCSPPTGTFTITILNPPADPLADPDGIGTPHTAVMTYTFTGNFVCDPPATPCRDRLPNEPTPVAQVLNANFQYDVGNCGFCIRMPNGHPCGPLEHQLTADVDGSGNVTVVFAQSTGVNDNSYGTTRVGWGSKDHTFGNLVGSDKAQFIFFNAAGQKVLDIFVDYISQKAGTPSGYGSLGVSGGEGKVNFGNAAHVLLATTSLDKNLNGLGFCVSGNCSGGGTNLLQNSPPTVSSNSYNLPIGSPYVGWDFVNSYTVKIAAAAFGPSGFGSVLIGEVHNSPPKCGSNAYTPVPCNGVVPPPAFCTGRVKPRRLEMKYLGTNCVSNCNTQAPGKVVVTGDPANDPSVFIVVTDAKSTSKVFFQGTVALNGTFTIDAGLAGKSKLGTNTIIKIFASQGGPLLSEIKFHTSCSQPLNPGDKYGSTQLINFIPG